jgi:hypothetical protein
VVIWIRFVAGVNAEERPAAILAAVRRRPPPGARLRRGNSSMGKTGELASYSMCKGMWRGSWFGARPAGTRGSPRQPLMASAGRLGPWKAGMRGARLAVPFYSGSVTTLRR